MATKPSLPVLCVCSAILVVSQGCASPPPPPTPAPSAVPTTAPPTSVPTVTPPPTRTPIPSQTPDALATLQVAEAEANIARYVDAGYLKSAEGMFYPLDEMQTELAKLNYVDVASAGYVDAVQDFAAWVDVEQESASTVNYPEYSGCGFVFRAQDSGMYYALLTKERVIVVSCLATGGGRCNEAGKTSGTGTVDLGSPFQAHFEFVMSGNHAYALVNGEFVAEYTLFADKLTTPGFFGYGMVSGTNKDYGTRCTMTNGKIWVPAE